MRRNKTLLKTDSMRLFFPILTLMFLLLSTSTVSWADPIQERLPNGLLANAEYQPANTKKPAVLVVHGFLQTYNFLATRNLINGVSGLGYTVLAPNLSLGIPSRKQSVQCNAAHTNTNEEDIKELDFWIDWLRGKGYNSVILVGHSWGSQQSLGYMLNNTDSPVTAIIAISLVRTRQNQKLQSSQTKLAEQFKTQGDKNLHGYALSFCKEYMATPDSYLSYANWTDSFVLNTLSTLHQRKVPVYVIVGDKDKRIDADWLSAIEKRVTKLVKIEGANHFFSHVSEFDLNDELEIILPKITQ